MLPDNSYHQRLDQYCELHPYFERSVRHFVNMFRYIPYSEVLDTLDYLIHDRFLDLILQDLEQGVNYQFIPFEPKKSGHYFTHLFVSLLLKEIDSKYHNQIQIYDSKISNIKSKYVIVDDGSYSGVQMKENMMQVPEGDLYIVLVAASRKAVNYIKTPDKVLPSKCILKDIFVGSIYDNIFTMDPKELYLEWDVIFESEGKLNTLLGLMSTEGTSSFYFQHKIPDGQSIPTCLLLGLLHPTTVDRILTREEKIQLIPNPETGYWEDIDRNRDQYIVNKTNYFPLVNDVTPFYKH